MRALYLALGRDLSAADAGATHTVNMARALAKCGVEVTVAARRAGEAAAGLRTVEADAGRPWQFERRRAAAKALEREAEGADIIQERAEESGGVGVALASRTGRPLVLEMNTPLSGNANPIVRRAADWNLRRQARRARAIITQTPASKRIIEEYTKVPVYVIPNGVDPDEFSPEVEPGAVPGAGPDRIIIAFAGSFRPWHGVEDLIEAAPAVLKKHARAFFLFVGGGERLREVRSGAKRTLGAGNFHFTGAVAPREVPGYLAAARILAAPFSPGRDHARIEQYERYGMWWSPVKVFEYMATGKPIVAGAAGQVSEYLAGAALVYPPGDTGALAECISRLIEDTGQAEALGRRARERAAAEYTWRAAAEQTAAAWRQVLGGRQKVSVTR